LHWCSFGTKSGIPVFYYFIESLSVSNSLDLSSNASSGRPEMWKFSWFYAIESMIGVPRLEDSILYANLFRQAAQRCVFILLSKLWLPNRHPLRGTGPAALAAPAIYV
jgi:hypothetical protein